jgi:hypothetical protein
VVGFSALPYLPSVILAALVAAGTGFFAASWNGIYLAEVARLSPADKVTEATSSSAVVTFLGYVSGPSIFSLLVTWTGGYRLPFIAVAGQLAAMAAVQGLVLVRRAKVAR